MAGTPDQFRKDIDAWVAKAKDQMMTLAVNSAATAAAEIKATTPRDTGFAQASWYPVINGAQAGSVPGWPGVQPGDVFGYYNNAVYIRRLEFGFVGTDSLGRTYNQAGRAFMRTVLAKWDQIVAAEAAKLGIR